MRIYESRETRHFWKFSGGGAGLTFAHREHLAIHRWEAVLSADGLSRDDKFVASFRCHQDESIANTIYHACQAEADFPVYDSQHDLTFVLTGKVRVMRQSNMALNGEFRTRNIEVTLELEFVNSWELNEVPLTTRIPEEWNEPSQH